MSNNFPFKLNAANGTGASVPEDAIRYLNALNGSASGYCFRTFDDNKERSDSKLARKFNGTLAEHYDNLKKLNSQGAGVFVVVNEGGHQDAEITRVRALFLDTDGAPIEPILSTIKPHLVIESSPGNWHVYIGVDEKFPQEMFKPVQQAMAAKFGTDSKVCNLSRVMRLPGWMHCKGTPVEVKIIEENAELARYSLEQIVQLLGLDLSDQKNLQPRPLDPRTGPDELAQALSGNSFPFTDENKVRISKALQARTNADGWNSLAKFLETMLAVRSLVREAAWPEGLVWKVFNAWAKRVDAGEGRYNEKKNLAMWNAKDRQGPNRITFRSLLMTPHQVQAPPQGHAITGITAAQLALKEFQPLVWIVPDILPEGCYLLSARPKVGKSWMALQLSLAVSKGMPLWGRSAVRGKAIYLALEENERRLQKRLGQLNPDWATDDLILYTDFKRANNGGLAAVEALLQEHQPKLLVIDTLAKFRPPSVRGGNAYEGDYQAVAPLTALAGNYRCCILIVTHNRKGKSEEDAIEQVSGTLGLSGACDGALVIEGARQDAMSKLTLIGRDIENDGEFAIRHLPTGGWEWLGKADAVFISKERQDVLDSLRIHGPMTPKEIAGSLFKAPGAIRKLLGGMLADGQLKYDGKKYHL